jgi:hypothetical protein
MIFCLMFLTSATLAQNKYALELFGGRNLAGESGELAQHWGDGTSAGLGFSYIFDRDVEFLGTAIFTRFPFVQGNAPILHSVSYVGSPFDMHAEDTYAVDLMFGPRLHAHAFSFLHPYLLMEAGVQYLRQGEVGTSVYPTISEMPGLYQSHKGKLGILVSLGLGLQVPVFENVNVNMEARWSVAFRQMYVPLLTSIQFEL